MIFGYQAIITGPLKGGDFGLFYRPEIPITIAGPSGSMLVAGLVDTGSDHTILPKSVADDLGIPLEESEGPGATAFGGQAVELASGLVTLRIEADGETVQWNTAVHFFDFAAGEAETVILGHAGFLDYFTATFDGKLGTLTLVTNDELPGA